ncbi:MAG: hypothetical protein SFV52_01180 [Saprospiraceae bacterium]|nr:hypothetical protein [Saprospiraceae bacterium]
MKKALFVFGICMSAALAGMAQKKVEYTPGGELGIGARFGGATGLTIKKYHRSNMSAFEFNLAYSFDDEVDGFTTNIFWERLAPIGFKDRLCAQFGFGVPLVFGDEFKTGVAGTIGFDWRLARRIGIQLDWSPAWLFINDNHFSSFDAAFSVRWLF